MAAKIKSSSNIAKYWAMFKLNAKDLLAYRSDLALSFLMRILYPLVMVFVWTVIYATTKTSHIGTYTLDSMILYFFLASVVSLILYTDLPYTIQHDIKHGAIASKLALPMGYVRYTVTTVIIENFTWAAMAELPLLIIILVVFRVHLSPIAVIEFIAMMGIGMGVSYSMEFIIGALSAYANDIHGFVIFEGLMASLLGGSMIPLSLFSGSAAQIISLLPFQYMFYLPITALTNPGAVAPEMFLGGLAWFAVLYVIGRLTWKQAYTSITSAGG
jgi:ABC-2 type transport system permease protein